MWQNSRLQYHSGVMEDLRAWSHSRAMTFYQIYCKIMSFGPTLGFVLQIMSSSLEMIFSRGKCTLILLSELLLAKRRKHGMVPCKLFQEDGIKSLSLALKKRSKPEPVQRIQTEWESWQLLLMRGTLKHLAWLVQQNQGWNKNQSFSVNLSRPNLNKEKDFLADMGINWPWICLG